MLRISTIVFVTLVGLPVWADDAPDYVKDIKPILQRRCYTCHGALKQKGGLRLDFSTGILKGGDGGPALEPGKPAESLMISAINGTDGLRRMPIEGEPLTAEEIAKITAWVNSGAKAPEEQAPADPLKHWSFQKPVRTALPTVANPAWQQNPVDAFVAAEHERKGLVAAPEAARHVLLRRVYLDLTGLPPTRQEVLDFQNDASPDAYTKIVDRLLASPQYGERWGRHWMDVWRYSDWDGYGTEVRESQPHIWRWRDWVVESLNANKGYDQMIQEMLAADEISPSDPDSLRATGFLARNYFKFNRNIWMDNTVEHTGKAFLGITVNCARCHDHMYDPIGQHEYYQMRAVFEPYDVRTDRVGNQADVTKDGLVRAYDAHLATPTYLFHRGDDKHPVKDKVIEPAAPVALGGQPLKWEPVALAPAVYYPGVQKTIHDEAAAAAEAEVKRVESALATAQQNVAGARKKLADFQVDPASATASLPILADNFAAARPELWRFGSGKWEYKDGRLLQQEPVQPGADAAALKALPRDFVAKLRFKITGGTMYKSVGLIFDAVKDQSAVGVYFSAGGSKSQLFTLTKGQMAYPAEALKTQPFPVGEIHEMQVYVRDQLVNVAANGQLAFAYKLTQPRTPNGELRLWAFDATAEFLSVQVDALPVETLLVEKVTSEQPLPMFAPVTAESLAEAIRLAEQAQTLAEARLATTVASRTAIQARIAADVATYSQPATSDAPALAEAAVKAERELALKQAQLNYLQQEHAVSAAKALVKPDDEKTKAAVTTAEAKLAETKKALDAAQATTQQPLTAAYTRFSTVYPTTSTGRRTALARWIASTDNPLTARVAINHLWLRHFGSPLVPTVFDLGLNGKAPTHPALLDWLAVELMENGWKMKQIHRLMVLSRTYRSVSHGQGVADPNAKLDPENIYLWRANSRRMEAEIVRDSTLAVSEQLDRTLGGPDLDPNTGLTVPRRSLYFRSAKEKKVTFLAMFDSANVVECYRRSESIVPQQALAMTNSPLTQAQARLLTKRLTTEVGAEMTPTVTDRFIEVAFQQVLARPVTTLEKEACVAFLATQTQRFSDPKSLTTFNAGVDTPVPPATIPHLRARENLVHVLLNHNDFVTIR